jgi:hypothetical protein
MNTKDKRPIAPKKKQMVERQHISKKLCSRNKIKLPPKPSVWQWREQVRARLASLVLISFVIICLALVISALMLATDSNDLLEITGRLLPYLIALLTPILHYYFGYKSNHDDKKR